MFFNAMNSNQSSPEYSSPLSKRSLPKAKFAAEDDEKLKSLVGELGENCWSKIAEKMGNRNARQCKERWENYLCPRINNAPFLAEEDELLLRKVNEIGTRWVTIAHFFPNRTDAIVKNRWHVLKRRERKLENLVQKMNTKVERFNLPSSIPEFSVYGNYESPCMEPYQIPQASTDMNYSTLFDEYYGYSEIDFNSVL